MATFGTTIFTGLFRHSLDDKNRLTIPSGWRLGEPGEATYLATPHPDGYIAVLPPSEVEKLHAKASQIPLTNRAAQEALARFFSASLALKFDKQGRVALDATLCEHAGITKETVLTGAGAKFHLYSPAKWAEVERRTSEQSYADTLRDIGF